MEEKKQLVVITGASSGIGERTALDFAAAGYPVLAIARRVERLTVLQAKYPSLIEVAQVDVTKFEEMKAAIEKAEQRFGVSVDLMVNNAGVMFLELFEKEDMNRIASMVSTNIIGVLNGCQAVLVGMIQRKHGTIVNISSIAGKKAFPQHTAYCGTKYFVHGFTEALREEVAHTNVRVICVAPGVVETELLSHNSKDVVEPYEKWKKTMDQILSSEDVSKVIMFAYSMPQHCCLREIDIAATQQKA